MGLRPPYPPYQVSLERSHVVMATILTDSLIALASYLLTYTPSHFAHTVQQGKEREAKKVQMLLTKQ